MSKTILYYTGNKKSLSFETKVQKTLLDNSLGLPIVSVSQKPLNLGKNICVGEVGASYLNVYRQMFIGAQTINTEYIILVEDDWLCPVEYFSFVPSGDFYRYDNCWVVTRMGRYFKTGALAGIAKRDLLVSLLTEYLDGCQEWGDGKVYPNKPDYMGYKYDLFSGPPLVHFKPTGNMSRSSAWSCEKASNLPLWGNVKRLRARYDFD